MKKTTKLLVLSLLLSCVLCVSAQAIDNDMLKVGLKYGEDALFSANLQNYNDSPAGRGYTMGYFDAGRVYIPLGPSTSEYKVTVTVDANFYSTGGNSYARGAGGVGGWHLQLQQIYYDYYDAADAAARYDGAFVAYVMDAYVVRVGQYYSQDEANAALASWSGADAAQTVSPSSTGVVVTVTDTNRVLFYFDCGGARSLAIVPQSISGEKPVTWFRGFRYYGGFEYRRAAGGNISVINVVDIEDYVKGSVPWEIGSDKPLEAIKAQAVCARTYAAMQTIHRSQGFDVCPTDHCQVYQGVAAGNAATDRAADETAGVYMYYNGQYVEAYYYSSNGGASEDAKNVWGNDVGYLKGKEDPYEAYVASRISNYHWTTTFTKSELAARLNARGINIGTVNDVYVSEFTPNGNVYSLTFVGSAGTRTVTREACRTTLGLRSLRFTIGGAGSAAAYYVNDSGGALSGLRGLYAITGSGTVAQYSGSDTDAYVITSSGTSKLERSTPASTSSSGTFTFTGSGWGHNVGMSQWGAVAMAELGYTYRDILEFYYTGIDIR